MVIDQILVLILGIGLMGFVYWFFLMKKEKAVEVVGSIDIKVKGGYNPSVIEIKKDQETTLNFVRNDPSSCLEEVVLADFKIRRFLPIGEKVSLKIKPTKPGEYPFSCGMNMYHGKIIVK